VQAGFADTSIVGIIRNTRVTWNTISGAAFDGVVVFTGNAPGSFIADTGIYHNQIFDNDRVGILGFTNFSSGGSDTKMINVDIEHNSIFGNLFGIDFNPFAGQNNAISGLTIANNWISDNVLAVLLEGGLLGATGNTLKASVRNNWITENSNPGGVAGIWVAGGDSASGNYATVKLTGNWVSDNDGAAIAAFGGIENSSNNTVSIQVRKNTLQNNTGTAIQGAGGWGAAFQPTGTSANNTLHMVITQNEGTDNGRHGIILVGGTGSSDGRADAVALNNLLYATVRRNTVEGSAANGIGIRGASSGLASSNTAEAEVEKNTSCGNVPDISVLGAFPGDAFFPPTVGTGNVAQVSLKKNVFTTLEIANGVPGNTALVAQSGNAPCP
jgi:hypothetical protein